MAVERSGEVEALAGRAELLKRCVLAAERAIQLSDQAEFPLAGALLAEAVDAIRNEIAACVAALNDR